MLEKERGCEFVIKASFNKKPQHYLPEKFQTTIGYSQQWDN